MLYDVCLYGGWASPDHLLAELDSKQIQGWLAYRKKCPFGKRTELAMLARLTAHVAAASGQRVTTEQFLPWETKERKVSPDQTLAAMPGGAAAMQRLLDEAAEKSKSDGSSGKPDNNDVSPDGWGDESPDADGDHC